jgi:hypothetical protein
MKRKKGDFIQQGDVLIFGGAVIPKSAKRLGARTLREGEHTGHAHVAVADDVALFIQDGVLYMSAPSGTEIVHEEHNPVSVPPGNYRIGVVREFDYLANMSREVLD